MAPDLRSAIHNPRRAGYWLAAEAAAFPLHKFALAESDDIFLEAGFSRQRYELELLVVSIATAVHAVEAFGLEPAQEHEAMLGIFDWIREQEPERQRLLLESVEEVSDSMSSAAEQDQEGELDLSNFRAGDEEFGERLMALGPVTESRMAACLRLCLHVPSTLWKVQVASATAFLRKHTSLASAGDA